MFLDELRYELGYTQQEMADALGVELKVYVEVERKTATAPPDLLNKMEETFMRRFTVLPDKTILVEPLSP